jgi:hypothetical protein
MVQRCRCRWHASSRKDIVQGSSAPHRHGAFGRTNIVQDLILQAVRLVRVVLDDPIALPEPPPGKACRDGARRDQPSARTAPRKQQEDEAEPGKA